MNTCIWRLAGVSLLALSISAQVLADDNQQQQQQRNEQRQQQRGFDQQRQQQQNQQRSFNEDAQRQQNQQRQQMQQQNQQQQQQRQQQQQQYQQQRQQEQLQQQRQNQQNQQQRFDQQRQQQDRQREQQQQQQQQIQQRQLQDRQGSLPIQSRPDAVRQTQDPRQSGSFARDNQRNNDNPWRGGVNRPDNGHWQGGRPGGHGDGWGSGPRYRPGYEIDRMPRGYSRVPYRGQDYFYSSGYWYRPQGPRYIVVTPPRGARVRVLPDYAQQVWLGSAMFFLAAGTYYTYEQSTQDYIVAEPPQGVEPVYSPQPTQASENPYEVTAYPVNGQSQQQFEQDRYDCYRFAVQQTNFDPAAATYQPAPEVIGVFRQNMANCYAGRGYSVQQ